MTYKIRFDAHRRGRKIDDIRYGLVCDVTLGTTRNRNEWTTFDWLAAQWSTLAQHCD